MGCSGCSTSSKGGGCSSGGCSSGGCGSKLPVFNWLSGIYEPKQDIVEVSFKNGRKGFYRNVNKLPIMSGDIVSVEGNPGYDVGIVSLSGDIVRLQMRKKKVDKKSDEIRKIYRKSSQTDIEKWHLAREREHETMHKTRVIAIDLGLDMKISDVEFQGDNTKATFYYTANSRVDFRELIKIMASEFKIRIEMKQIGARQESSRLGGIASCGRELCCSSWLTDFRTVNTSAARYQQLSLNPQKLAGQCGKLKCCLNFELDSYIDALQHFPNTNQPLQTKAGKAFSMKVDIFGNKILYSVREEFVTHWFELSTETVKEIISLNKKGIIPDTLEDYAIQKEEEVIATFENVVGQDSLTRFDKSIGGNSKNKRNKRNNSPRRKFKNNNDNSTTTKEETRRPVRNRKPNNARKPNPNQEVPRLKTERKSNENKNKQVPSLKLNQKPKPKNKKRITANRTNSKSTSDNTTKDDAVKNNKPKRSNRPKFTRRKPKNTNKGDE